MHNKEVAAEQSSHSQTIYDGPVSDMVTIAETERGADPCDYGYDASLQCKASGQINCLAAYCEHRAWDKRLDEGEGLMRVRVLQTCTRSVWFSCSRLP